MKIEKINENKLKIVLSKQDLIDKDIDIHTLNPNSMESQDLFFDILQEVEFYYGFDMNNSQILLEGVSTSNGGMILTVTKSNKNASLHEDFQNIINTNSNKIKVTKKENSTKELIYKFNCFDDFNEFISRLKHITIKYKNSLYQLDNNYYLIVISTNTNTETYKKLLYILSDYATFKTNTNFKNKLMEYGKCIISNNSIQTIKKYL